MKTLACATAGICAGLTLAAMAPEAVGQTFKEHRSTLTVAEPLEVPGKILDPGTYVIKVLETQNNRNIVQVTDVEEKTVLAMAIATPHVGLTPPPNTTFVYYPTASGATATRTLRTWFAPNDRYGQDFVYPRARAVELARVAREPVRSYEIVGNATPLTQRELETIEVRDVTDDSVAEPAQASAPSSVIAGRLPETASDLPALGALGLLALGGAGALRLSRNLWPS